MSGVSKKFEAACMDLREGRIDFATFRERTTGNWRSLSKYILRRWHCPPAVSDEDVAQELLIAAWELVSVWDPSRENAWPLGRFLVWRACNRAKAWVHKQRGGGDDRAKGRWAIPFSSLTRDDDGEDGGELERRFAGVATPAEQEDDAETRREQLVVLSTMHREDAVAVAALFVARGDVAEAAQRLYGHPDARRIARLGNEKQARRKIACARELLLAAG